MGFLDTAPAAANDSEPAAAEPEATEAAEPEGEGSSEAQEVEAPKPAAAPVTIGRRATNKRLDHYESTLKSVQESLTKRQEQFQQALAQRDQELSRMRGYLEGQAQHVARSAPVQQGPDPEQLYREADEALDRKDYDTWRKKHAQAIKIEARQEIMTELAPVLQQRQQAAGGVPPELLGFMAANPAVASAGPQGLSWVRHFDSQLDLENVAPGPDRVRRAFEMAQNRLSGGGKGRPSYPASSAALLTGTPSGRGSGSGKASSPTVTPRPEEERMRVAAGMSKEEYYGLIAEADPSRVERG